MVIEPQDVDRVSALVGELAAGDAPGLSKDQLLDMVESIATLERRVGALSSRYAAELAQRSTPDKFGGGLARQQGFGNADKMWSKIRGGTVTGAKRSIAAGDAFTPRPQAPSGDGPITADAPAKQAPKSKYPVVAKASMAGELSVDAAGLIVDGLNKVRESLETQELDALEQRLVSKAVSMSAHDVQKMVTRAVARLDRVAHKKRERENHEARYLWWKQDSQGKVVIHGEMDSVTAAPIISVLEQMTTRDVRRKGRDEGENADTRTVGQMRVDALHDLAKHALGRTETKRSGVRTTVVVRMGLSDLLSGEGLGRIDGMEQPISVRELRRLSGEMGVIPQVLAGDGDVLDLGRRQRLFTGPQRTALLERDGGCAKCHAPPQHCEAHHIRWWESGGGTDLSNGVMLCTRCHHDIHAQGWEIDATPTAVTFIPPPNIDKGRVPQPGGFAALDVELPVRRPDLPTITPEDEVMVQAWAQADWARLDGAWQNEGTGQAESEWRAHEFLHV